MAVKTIQVIGKNGQSTSADIMATYLGDETNNYTYDSLNDKLDLKAPLASPIFVGAPQAPTPATGDDSKRIATTAWVQDLVSSAVGDLNDEISTFSGAMIFKGTIGTSGATVSALPSAPSVGWTYRVITAGTWAGVTCEIGDMITCITAPTSTSSAVWTVYQTNIDGAVTGPAAATNNAVAIFNGTTGKIIKNSGFTIGKSVPSNAVFTDTTYTAGSGLTLKDGVFSITPMENLDSVINYGPEDGAQLSFGETFIVPGFQVDGDGRISQAANFQLDLPPLAMKINPSEEVVAAMPDGAFYLVI